MKAKLVQLTTENGTPIITDDRSIRIIGIIILIATFGILGTWGYLAPIDSAALAPGNVTVKSHRKTVQHLDGGIVRQLLAKDGDVVKEGDVLLILDGTEVKAQLEILRGQHITLAAQLARLVAERDQLNQIKYPDDLQDLSDKHIAEARQGENQIFSSRKSAYQGEISVLNQKANQLSSRIKGLEGQRRSKQELIKSYEDELHDLKELLAEGFANKQRLRDIERYYANATGDAASLSAEIATDQIQINETKLQILQIQKKFQQEVAANLGEVQAKLFDVTQRLLATQDKVTRTEIKAPSNGRVLGLSIHNIGGVITQQFSLWHQSAKIED